MKRKYITLNKKEDIILFEVLKEKSDTKSDVEFMRELLKAKASLLGVTKIDIEV